MPFSSTELSGFRTAQTEHMFDTCVIQTYSENFNSFGEPISSYADGSAINCGLDTKPSGERRKASNTVIEYDATIRLAITVVPNVKDRIKVTKRFGETLTPNLVYEIAGPIQQGPSGIRLLLRKVSV